MKRCFAICLSLWLIDVQAQITLACQFKEGQGFYFDKGEWKPSRFRAQKPFFLTIRQDNRLESASALSALDGTTIEASSSLLKIIPELIHCFEPDTLYQLSVCANNSGSAIAISLKNLEGAVSRILGAAATSRAGSGSYRDSLAIFPFVCQKI